MFWDSKRNDCITYCFILLSIIIDHYLLSIITSSLHHSTLFAFFFLILFLFGFGTYYFGWYASLCFFFLTDRGFGPFTTFVFIWMPFSEDNCFILFFLSYSALTLLSCTIYSIYFSWGNNLLWCYFWRLSSCFLWISYIVILWSGPKYIIGILFNDLSILLS